MRKSLFVRISAIILVCILTFSCLNISLINNVKADSVTTPNTVTYDYTDLNEFPIINGTTSNLNEYKHKLKLGMYDMSFNADSNDANYAALQRENAGGIRAGYGYLYSHAQGTVMPYVTYQVKPATVFSAELYIKDGNTGNGKGAWEALDCYTGKKFEFKFQASVDGNDWDDIASTEDNSGTFDFSFNVPENAYFIRIVFPQDGNPNGKNVGGTIFNDTALLKSVTYTPANEEYNYIDTKKLPVETEGKVIAANTVKNLGAYTVSYDGTGATSTLDRMASGELRAGYGYLKAYAAGEAMPYIVYSVDANSIFSCHLYIKATGGNNNKQIWESIEHNSGKKYELKFQTSADGMFWSDVYSTGDKAGNIDVLISEMPEDTRYLRIVFPQDGNLNGENGNPGISLFNDSIAIYKVSFTKSSSDIEIGVYDYRDVNKIPVTEQMNNDYAAVHTNEQLTTLGASEFSVNSKTNDIGYSALNRLYSSGGIYAGYGYLLTYDAGNAIPYIQYSVTPGTSFSALVWVKGGTQVDSKRTWENVQYYKDLNKKFEFKLQVSFDGITWTDAASTGDAVGETVLKIDKLSNDTYFVRVVFPQDGNYAGANNPVQMFNRSAALYAVKFTPYEEPADELVYYNYCDLEKFPLGDFSRNVINFVTYPSIEKYGMCDASMNFETLKNEDYAALQRVKSGALRAGYGYLLTHDPGTASSYAVYSVKGGRKFEAVVSITESARNNWEKLDIYSGRHFEFKLEYSSNGDDWTQIAATDGAYGNEIYLTAQRLPINARFVRIVFPQDGNPSGANKSGTIFNDGAELKSVCFTPGEDNLLYPNDIIFNEGIASDFNSEQEITANGMFDCRGVSVAKFPDSTLKLGAKWSYIYNDLNLEVKPYAVYNVVPNTDMIVSVSRSKDCADIETKNGLKNGEWTVAFYESSNGSDWNKIEPNILYTAKNVGIGEEVVYKFHLSYTTKYIKLEMPHTGNMSGAAGSGNAGNHYIGISRIAYTSGNAEYSDPYGNYEFEKSIDYTSLVENHTLITECLVNDCSFYDLLAGGLEINPNFGITACYEYLYKTAAISAPYFVYNVKPGTAFQITAKYDSAVRRAVTAAMGKEFVVRFYTSADSKNWKQVDLKITYLPKKEGRFDLFEIYTLENVPKDINYIKVEFPQTGNMSMVVPDATQYAGNDFIGILLASYTNGNAVSPARSELDMANYKNSIDFSSGEEIDIREFDASGVDYVQKSKQLRANYKYFYFANKYEREKPYVILPVQSGKAFYAEAATRKNIYYSFGEKEFEYKLYASSDKVNWTDVTADYTYKVMNEEEVYRVLTKFVISSVPEGIKYLKIEMPNYRNYTDYVTERGDKIKYLGNDFSGITKILYNEGTYESKKYEHTIDYDAIVRKYKDMPSDVGENNKGILGLDKFTESAFQVTTAFDSYLDKFVLWVKKNHVFDARKIQNPYLVYNVKPNTAFEISLLVDEEQVYKCSPDLSFKVYTSATGGDNAAEWTELKNGYYNYLLDNTKLSGNIIFRTGNVGAKTNYVKVVFPQTGDLNVLYNQAVSTPGETFFAVEYVNCSLTNYSEEYKGKEDQKYVFLKPNNVVLKPADNNAKETGLKVWQIAVIAAVSAVAVAGVLVITIIIIRKRKNKKQNI